MGYTSIIQARGQAIPSTIASAGPMVLAATGQSLTREAVISTTTGGPPATAITSLGNSHDGWISWLQTLYPCFIADVWRDVTGGTPNVGVLPQNPLDTRVIAQSGNNGLLTSDARMYYGYNHARGEQLVEAAQANSDLLIAMRPSFVIVGIGESQIISDTESVLRGKLTTLVQTILDGNQNCRVLLTVPFTRSELNGASGWTIGNATFDGYRQKIIDLSTNLFSVYDGNPRVRVFDPNPIHTGTTSLAIPRPFCVRDHVHLTPKGAYYVAKAAVEILKEWGFGNFQATLYPNLPAYNASTNPLGNWIANFSLTGVGGTKGAGTSGTVPDRCQVLRTIGTTGTAVCSIVVEQGKNKIRIAFTAPTAEISTFEIIFGTSDVAGTTASNNPYAIRTWIKSHLFVECSADSDWRQVRLKQRVSSDNFNSFGGSSTNYGSTRGLQSNESGYTPGSALINSMLPHMPDESWSGYIQTTPYCMLNAATGQLDFRLIVSIGPLAVNPVIKISNPCLRSLGVDGSSGDPRNVYRSTSISGS